MRKAIQRKRRRDPEQIRELLSRYRQSNLTKAQFVAREGMCLATLRKYCQGEATPAGGPAEPRRFVEVERPERGFELGSRELYRVCFENGAHLEIPPGFSVKEVEGLLELVAAIVGR